ncbi:MAG: hypothetical protein AB1546_05480 [bacterium]
MKVWSKGLGDIELILDFEKYRIEKEKSAEGEKIYIKGIITDPVYWDFRITMTKNDVPGLLNIALNSSIILLFLRNIRASMSFIFRRFVLRKIKTQ